LCCTVLYTDNPSSILYHAINVASVVHVAQSFQNMPTCTHSTISNTFTLTIILIHDLQMVLTIATLKRATARACAMNVYAVYRAVLHLLYLCGDVLCCHCQGYCDFTYSETNHHCCTEHGSRYTRINVYASIPAGLILNCINARSFVQ